MGARKRISAEARKEAQKTMYFRKVAECADFSSQDASRCRHDPWNGSIPCTWCFEVFLTRKLQQE